MQRFVFMEFVRKQGPACLNLDQRTNVVALLSTSFILPQNYDTINLIQKLAEDLPWLLLPLSPQLRLPSLVATEGAVGRLF